MNTSSGMRIVKNVFSYIGRHKVTSAIVLVVLVGGAYWYQSSQSSTTAMRYTMTSATTDTLITAVSGTGQVSPSNSVEVKPKVSGDVLSVLVQNGDTVAAGQAIAYLDSTDAQNNVADAQSSLQAAELSLQKLQEPADQLSVTQSQNAIAKAQDQLLTSQTDLTKAYQDAYNDVISTYLDLPSIMTGLQDVDTGTQAARGAQWNIDYYRNATEGWVSTASSYRDDAYNGYTAAKTAYDTGYSDYKATGQTSSTSTIESILNETYTTTKSVSNAINSSNSFLQFYEDQVKTHGLPAASTADTGITNLGNYISKVNSHLTALLSDINTIKSDKQSIADAQRTITENQQSFQKLSSGTDPLDIKSSQLSVDQKKNALAQAQETLNDYVVRAPISGMVANLTIHKGDTVGSATVATIITKQQMADLSLNEIDAAKVASGQKATMTFDAIDGLTISGVVTNLDPLGTVSQGVVSYDVKIAMDTIDPRVRAGMSVNASIVTNVKQDALIVPSSAVKTQNGSSYVLVFDSLPSGVSTSTAESAGFVSSTAPTQQSVTIGLTNDTESEITSGISDGQLVVSRSAANTTTKTASSGGSILSALGGGGPGGGGGGTLRTTTGSAAARTTTTGR